MIQTKFSSKVFVGNKKNSLILRILFGTIAVIILFAVLIKLIVGDFHFSDLSVVIISILVLITCKNNGTPTPQFVPAIGNIDFDNDEMAITYENVNSDAEGKFTDITVVKYNTIESIQYSRELMGYCIVGKGLHKKIFIDSNREEILDNGESITNIYMYVLDEDEDVDIRENLQKYSGCIVSILDADSENYE